MKKKDMIIVTVNILIFITIMLLVKFNLTIGFDNAVYSAIAKTMNPLLTPLVISITLLGNAITVVAIVAFLLWLLRKNKYYYLPLLDVAITSIILNYIIKIIIMRPRPDVLRLIEIGGYSFPSGHAMNNMAIYFALFLIINHYMKDSAKKKVLKIITITLPFLIGLSRIYVGVHYATDVLAGWILGGTLAYVIFILWLKFGKILETKKERSN